MRHFVRAFVLVVVIVAAAPGSAATGAEGVQPATLATPWPVTRLAADGAVVAVATEREPCGLVGAQAGQVVLWTASTTRTRRFASGACADEIAVAGSRVAWLIHYCGNSCQLLVVLPKASGFQREIDEADNGAGASGDETGEYVANLYGAGSLLAYGKWEVVCTETDPQYPEVCEGTGIRQRRTVRIVGARPTVIRRGTEAAAVRAVGGGRVALHSADGLFVRDARGKLVTSVTDPPDDPPRGVALSQTSLVVERARTIDVYGVGNGKKLRSVPLRAAAALRLSGLGSGLALLRGPRRLVIVRLRDGKRRSIPLGTGSAKVVDARLTDAGVFYAYNPATRGARGRVVFEPLARLLALF
jgi:hypothetical protein